MTKFYNYINENKEIADLIDDEEKDLALQKVIELLEKDCKPFINEWKRLNTNDFIYSGRKEYNLFTKKSVRQNRQPLNTRPYIHNVVNAWFKENFGVKARSNSIFCSFDMDMIEGYGYEHFIFPIGNYKVISSSDVEDLFIDIQKYLSFKKFGGYSSSNELKNDPVLLKELIFKFMDKSNYKERLQRHDNEIMLICKEVYLMAWTDFYERGLLKHFK